MPSYQDASDNVGEARRRVEAGDWRGGLSILLHGRPQPSEGDSYAPQTSPGDSYPYYPYVPPTGPPVYDYAPQPSYTVEPGWYSDPFDGVGSRWWNGQGWTDATAG